MDHGPTTFDGVSALRRGESSEPPKTCPLFQEHAGRIAQELQASGLLDLSPEEDIEALVWQVLESEAPCLRKGTKTNLARFQAGRRAAASLLSKWSAKRFVYEYVALESNMLDSRSTAALIMKDVGPTIDENGGEVKQTTSAARPTATEATLRSACQNFVSGTANNQSGAIFFEKYLETWKSNYVSARDLGIAKAAPAPTRLRSYAQALNGNGTNARST